MSQSPCEHRRSDPWDVPFAPGAHGRNLFSRASLRAACHQHSQTPRALGEPKEIQLLDLQLEKLRDAFIQIPTSLAATCPAGLPLALLSAKQLCSRRADGEWTAEMLRPVQVPQMVSVGPWQKRLLFWTLPLAFLCLASPSPAPL